MGKYSSYSRRDAPSPKIRTIHPIWRGVGFAFIIIIPIFSYAAALVLIEQNSKSGWFQIPADLIFKGADPLLYIKIIVTITIAFILYIIFMLITFLVYSMFGPKRYGPYDVPPIKYRRKRG